MKIYTHEISNEESEHKYNNNIDVKKTKRKRNEYTHSQSHYKIDIK